MVFTLLGYAATVLALLVALRLHRAHAGRDTLGLLVCGWLLVAVIVLQASTMLLGVAFTPASGSAAIGGIMLIGGYSSWAWVLIDAVYFALLFAIVRRLTAEPA